MAKTRLFARTLVSHVGRDSALMKMLDPRQSDGLLTSLSKTVDDQLTQQRDHLLKEFSLDNKDGALTRLITQLTSNHGDLSKDIQTKIDVIIKEFSLNEENSALSRLVQNVTQAQRTITNEFSLDSDTSCLSRLKRELKDLLDRLGKEEPALPGRGQSFAGKDRHTARGSRSQHPPRPGIRRRRVRIHHSPIAARGRRRHADRPHDRPHQELPNRRLPDRTGPGQRSPWRRSPSRPKRRTTTPWPKPARKSKPPARIAAPTGACSCSRKRLRPPNLEPFARYGSDFIVVWDAEDTSTDVFLKAGIIAARALCFRTERQSAAQQVDFETIDKAILEIEKRAGNLDDVRK